MITIGGKPAPLIIPLLAVITGIITGSNISESYGVCFLVLSVILAVISVIIFKSSKIIYALITITAAILLFSSYRIISTKIPGSYDMSRILPYEGKVEGKVSVSRKELILNIKTANNKKVRGKIYVHWDKEPPPPFSTVEIFGKFIAPKQPNNPEGFNWKKYLENRGILSEVYPLYVKVIKKGFISKTVGDLRFYINSTIDKYFEKTEAGLLKGMLLGDSDEISEELQKSFRNTGVAHILAVSGLHVGLILYTFFYFFISIGFSKKKGMIAALICIWIYVLISGCRPSAIRASLMISLMCAGTYFGGRGNAYNNLCFAAIIILLMSPGQLFGLGFKLSFLAVLGILYITPVFEKKIGKPLAVSIGAMLPLVPVLSSNFFFLPLISPVTNLIVVPLSGIIIPLGMLIISISDLIPLIAELYSYSLKYVVGIVIGLTSIIDRMGVSGISIGQFHPLTAAGYYLVLCSLGLSKKGRLRSVVILLAILLFSFPLLKEIFFTDRFIAGIRKDNSLTYVIKEGKGRTIIIAGKTDTDYYEMRRFLYKKRITKICDIYIPHPPDSEYNNLYRIAEEFSSRIIVPDTVIDEFRWNKSIVNKDIVRTTKTGEIFDYKSMYVNILGPDKKYIDLRDNYLQMSVEGKNRIFIYCGGEIPVGSFEYIISLGPYKPDYKGLMKKNPVKIFTSAGEIIKDKEFNPGEKGFILKI